jgi:UDP-N-acetylglucosamine:LPS N-acetylglucosamine transferase
MAKFESVESRIAYFISPHGYGHAARAAAVMMALRARDPAIRFEIFTLIPRWFFEDSLSEPFGYHSLLTDIGLVQKTPLIEDLPETLRRLDNLLPFDGPRIQEIAGQVSRLQCQLVICDIAPMGIAVAREAGIPSVLVENFTWDWIYQGYVEYEPRLTTHISYLQDLFDKSDYHIQTEPVCQRHTADLTTSPVSRKVRTPAREIRRQLGIPDTARMVMITMGGIPWDYTFLDQVTHQNNLYFVIPGAAEKMQVRTNSPDGSSGLVLFPHHSDFFHPDLLNACDAIIGKVGYSTLAEVYSAGVPFGYVARPKFRESQVLTAFIEQQIQGLAIAETEFRNGRWLSLVSDLLALPRIRRQGAAGADQVAYFLGELLDKI